MDYIFLFNPICYFSYHLTDLNWDLDTKKQFLQINILSWHYFLQLLASQDRNHF